MKPLGKLITATTVENKFWKQELQRFLLIVPHLFNRTVKGLLPQLPCKKVLNKHKLAKAKIENRKASNKRHQDKRRHVKESDIDVGDIVICKQPKSNKTTPYFSPEKFVVVKRRGTTIFAENERHSRKRNISHFKTVGRRNSELSELSESEADIYINAPDKTNLYPQRNHDELPLRRSTRTPKHVHRYGNVIPSDMDFD